MTEQMTTREQHEVARRERGGDIGARLHDARMHLEATRAFVKDVLVGGKDYGTIPGTDKPTLYKAGAESACMFLNLAPTMEAEVAVEDWEREIPFFNYRYKCRLINRGTGEVVGEGLGSCNSKESKYRYRTEYWRDKQNDPPEGQGWERWKGKFGWTFRRRIENPDTADVANTVLKMAKKRAFVDAVLTAAGLSEFFAQDLEDIAIDYDMLREHDGTTVSGSGRGMADADREAIEEGRGKIAQADTLDALKEVAGWIRQQTKAVQEHLRPTYGSRNAELKAATQAEEGEAA